jgi:peptide/nickel transport system permease protein
VSTPLVEAAGPHSGLLASWHAWWAEHTRLRRFLTRTGVILSILWLALVIVAAIFAPLVAPHDPDAQNLLATNAPVSANHLLGTDDLGRDVLSRLIYGARISMEVPFMTVGLALVLALVIGLVAGYRGGRIDYLLMRGADAGLAFPPLVLALAVVAVLGTGVGDVALALALVFAPGFARFIRGQTLAVKEESFVEASQSIGTPPARIVVFRVLPNVMTGLVVQIAIALGAALLAESGLAFLGLGPPPPAADWGSMLREAYDNSLFTHPWSLVPAGATIALTVLAFNTIGDALRDTLSGTAATAKRSRGARRQRGLTVVDRPTQPAVTTGSGAEQVTTPALLEVRDLCIEFDTAAGPVRVVDDVSFDVGAGRIVGLVGESGCGKTVSSLSILRLLPSPPARIVGGSIRFKGQDLLDADFAQLRQVRGRDIAMVFQDPLASLDPVFTIGYQLTEAITLHERVTKKAAAARAVSLLESVHIPDAEQRLGAYPHQLSGGMRQRVMIAMALSCHPSLLIADEPTTALDVTVQAQIVELLHELREQEGLAVLFVTHDLALISELSDEIAVMYAGQVVEHAPTADIFAHPAAPLHRRPPGRHPRGTARRRGSPLPHRRTGCPRAGSSPRAVASIPAATTPRSAVRAKRSSSWRRSAPIARAAACGQRELTLPGVGDPPWGARSPCTRCARSVSDHRARGPPGGADGGSGGRARLVSL